MDRCYILSEDEDIVKICYSMLEYTINKHHNALICLKSESETCVDAVIPHTFPSGHKIDWLYKECLKGIYNKVIISNGINMFPEAFARSSVNEVVWPDDCTVIPSCCFWNSRLTQISNIQNVQSIEENAFALSSLEEITWPPKCEIIPKSCFSRSDLRRINNLDKVLIVQMGAFCETSLDCIDFSSAMDIYLEPSSLWGLDIFCKVIVPYYIDKDIYKRAFGRPNP